MADTKDGRSAGPKPSASDPGADGGVGFKFNQVGRQEPAAQVLVPQVDPAMRRRRFFIVGLAILALIVLALIVANPFGFEKSGGSGRGGEFNPPEHSLQ